MNHEVEAYVGELRELREENETLREKLKAYEVEAAWSDHHKLEEGYMVDWDLHNMIIRKDMREMS